MVLWYHSTMNIVATNVRFPADEYQKLKLLALYQVRSIAAVIREAVRIYVRQKITAKMKISLIEKLKLNPGKNY